MKKILSLFILLLFVTGCSINKVQYESYEDVVNNVLSYETKLKNVSFDGYSYYIPKGFLYVEKRDSNSIIKYNDVNLFLYVDVTSYYHKVDIEYEKKEDIYYSSSINHNDKKGYLEITKLNDIYFVEFMYNYAKFEAYVTLNDLNDVIYQMTLVLSSIDYNDKILESLIGNNLLQYSEESFNILKPKKDKENNYLDFDYDQMYEDYQGEIKDEDSIEIMDDKER